MDVSPARAVVLYLLLLVAFALSPALVMADQRAPGVPAPPAAPVPPADISPVIAKGKTVAIEYTLTLEDGSTVQSNVGGAPLSFVAGKGQIIPGLEAALEGKAARERVKVTVPPEQAYGISDPQKMQQVSLDKIPEEARKVGKLLRAEGIDGPVRVAEVRPDAVVLDFNHPLAGKALTFDVLVLSIN